jgi:hypothetical protein
MSPNPYPFEDFLRAKQRLHRALFEHHEPFALLNGETGSGKTALLRELRADIERARYRVVYFAQARKLGAVGLIKVIGEGLRVRPSLCHALSLERLLHARRWRQYPGLSAPQDEAHGRDHLAWRPRRLSTAATAPPSECHRDPCPSRRPFGYGNPR